MEKKKQNVLLIFMGLLIMAELVITTSVVTLDALTYIPIIVSLVFVAFYGFWLYKKPHGNILKYAMLLFAVSIILNAVVAAYNNWGAMYHQVLRLFASASICYCAGRLNRVEQNKMILPIAELLLIVYAVAGASSAVGNVSSLSILIFFSYPITLLTLMIAYFVRFKEHKEAGISDK